MIEDSKEYWLRVEDTHIIMSEKNKVYTAAVIAVIAFLHKIYSLNEKNNTT